MEMDMKQTGPVGAAEEAVACFERAWGDGKPEIIAITPGRVCLIGEHIDYSGYPVATMAIDRYCFCALSSKRLTDNNSNNINSKDNGDATNARQKQEEERRDSTKLEVHNNGAFEGFLAVRHSKSTQFAPLYIQSVELVFPALQAALRQCGHSFSAQECDGHEHQEWHSYLLAGCLGALEFCASHSALLIGNITDDSWEECARQMAEKTPRLSMKAVVSGNLPLGAGLSSSSALVVSVASAIITAFGCDATLKEIAEICTRAERYVGVQGGGMDQACLCLARSGCASLIAFNPLQVEYLKLPDCCTLALGYCGADALKIVDSDKKYNLRVLECKLAALLLMGAGPSLPGPVQSLGKIDLSYVQANFLGSLADAAVVVQSLLHEEPYGKEELQNLLGDLIKRLLNELPSLTGAWERNANFKLRQRAFHVFSEALRVRQFAEVCRRECPDEEKLSAMGRLANASHFSCKNNFECSSERLDAFVSSALVNGAVGSRLTGAGWGGFTVSFLPKGTQQEFEKKERNLPLHY